MALLTLSNVEVVYDKVFLAIKGVSMSIEEGGMIALLGANGAGKSTTLKAISGLLGPERGAVTRGEIRFADRNLLLNVFVSLGAMVLALLASIGQSGLLFTTEPEE